MLCEHCQERKANIHVAVVSWPSGEVRMHICESCYSAAEEERTKAYTSKPTADFPANIENLTAFEFLEASARANRNSADRPVFKRILEELSGLPETRQRLALQLLSLAWQALEGGADSAFEMILFGCRSVSMQPERLPEYTAWLEKIILRSFDLRKQLPNAPDALGTFGMTLSMTLRALGVTDRDQFVRVLGTLKRQGGRAELDARWAVIDDVEKSVLHPGEQRQ